MKQLLSKTAAYRILQGELAQDKCSHTYLLLFDDERLLRPALKFFAVRIVADTPRKSALVIKEEFCDCPFYPPEAGEKLNAELAGQIVEESVLRPTEGSRKLFVLDGMQTANATVQNKLLKVLEEPPEGTHFLLGATGRSNLLPTVLSRAKVLEIPPFPEKEVAAFLERHYPQADKALRAEAVVGCNGVVGRAASIVEGDYYDAYLDLAVQMVATPMEGIPAISREAVSITRKAEFLGLIQTVLRDALMIRTGGEILLKKKESMLKKIAKSYSTPSLVAAIELVTDAEREIAFNANFPQAVEVLLVKIKKEKIRWYKLSE